MSRRQLKKISGYDETEELKKAMGLNDTDFNNEAKKATIGKTNKNNRAGFSSAFLDFEEDNIAGEESENDSIEDIPVPVQVSKKSKKKRNKKKNKEKNTKKDGFDDILENYGFKNNGEQPIEDKSENFSKSKSVLQIEGKYLDPEAELKRIFGNAAVNVDRNQTNRRNAHRNKQFRTGTIVSRVNVQAMPGGRGGLSMVEDEKKTNDNIQWWRFTHNRDYQEIQGAFLAAINSSSHEMLMAIIQRHPSHCDSLLSLSDACRLQDDSQSAKELLERLLYVMESSLHPRCVIGNGKNRFDYKRPENRPFFGGLFRYCQLSAQRGCWRTALEQAKLLLSFDPTDPLAVVLLIPLYAVRSGKFEELIEMESELSYRNVESLPNWALSLSLALIHLDRIEEARLKLKQCLLDHPGLLFPLLEKMQADPCPELKNCVHFNTVESLAKKTLYKLICSRETDLWKDGNAQSLLQSVAQDMVVDMVGRGQSSHKSGKKIPPQIIRHAILCDLPIADLKPEESLSHDPLPPDDPIIEYTPKPPVTNNTSLGHVPFIPQHIIASMIPGFENEQTLDVQQQVRSLVDSMSSLLDQIRFVTDVPDVPDAEEVNEEEFD